MGRKPKNAATKASVSPEDILVSYLKEKEEEHYNFEPEINYKVSTGSLLLDIETGGRARPGSSQVLRNQRRRKDFSVFRDYEELPYLRRKLQSSPF